MSESCRGYQTGRIVIVDPHDDSRDLYVDYLEWVGFHVAAVSLAADALSLMSDRIPDAVVTCLRLPDMDGFALCDALRAMPHTSRVPVIAVSSCPGDHDRAVIGRRFATVLMKPCLPDVLVDSLRVTLDAQNQPA